MKLANEIPAIQSHGQEEVTNFSIEVSAQAFSILSSGLYKNPIRAIIRELSTNAVDAHQEAGTSDKPFDVEFPTKFSPIFRIRDYGTGLSKKDVLGLYSTYFNSTKTDTNDQIGALGLGSKSPLGYTNSFSVVSYFKGIKYNFSVFIGENGFPNIAVTNTAKTDEPNGLEIIIPVKEDSYYMSKWYKQAQEIYQYFDTTPNIMGAEIEVKKPKYVRKVGQVKVREENGYHADRFVVQGNISYPLDLSDLDLTHSVREVLQEFGFDVYVNIGDVSFLPNREELSYDEKTKECLARYISVFVNDLKKEITKDLKTIRTLDDALKTTSEINDKYLKLVNSQTDLIDTIKTKFDRWSKFIDLEINSWSIRPSYKIMTMLKSLEKSNRFQKVIFFWEGKRVSNLSYSPTSDLEFWINDTKKSVITKFGKAYKKRKNAILIQGFDDKKKAVDFIKRKFGVTNSFIKYVSDLDLPVTVSVRNKHTIINRYRLASYSNSYYANKDWRWERGIALDQPCYEEFSGHEYVWVEQKGHQAVGYFREDQVDFGSFLGGENNDRWGVHDVYGVKTRDVPQIKDRKNWIHINDYVMKKVRQSVKDHTNSARIFNIEGLESIISLSRYISVDDINNAEIKAILDIVKSPSSSTWVNQAKQNLLWLGYETFEEIGVDFDPQMVYNDSYLLEKFIDENYPHLDVISSVSTRNTEKVVNLINDLY